MLLFSEKKETTFTRSLSSLSYLEHLHTQLLMEWQTSAFFAQVKSLPKMTRPWVIRLSLILNFISARSCCSHTGHFKRLRSTKCFHFPGLSFLCFQFPRTLSPGFANVIHTVVLDTIIIILQMMKLTPGRLNNLPKA